MVSPSTICALYPLPNTTMPFESMAVATSTIARSCRPGSPVGRDSHENASVVVPGGAHFVYWHPSFKTGASDDDEKAS